MAGIAPITPGTRAAIAKAAAAKAAAAKAAAAASGKGPLTQSPVPALKTGGTVVKVNGAPVGTVNAAGVRNFLISKGYDLPKTNDPNIGTALAAAMNNWGLHNIPAKFGSTAAVVTLMQQKGWKADGYSGKQNPSIFNSAAGSGDKTGTGAAANFTPAGNVKFNANSGSTYDPASLTSAAGATGTVPIDENLAYGGAKTLDANALAQALSGAQFDPQIQSLTDQQGKNKAQTAQDLHDIGAWYDQALGSMKNAATRDTAITKAGQDSITGADKAIIDSLGGDASAGASTVGEAAANGENTLAALGANQDQYNQDLAPIQALAKSGALSTETAAGAGRSNDLAMQLAAARSDKSGSMAQHLLDITNTNNTIRDNQIQRLLQIKSQNAAQVQQNFANSQSVAGTNIAAIAAGAKLAAAQNRAAPGSFEGTPASVKAQVASTIFNDLASAKPTSAAQANAIVMSRLNGAGWNAGANPNVKAYAQSILNGWSQSTGTQLP